MNIKCVIMLMSTPHVPFLQLSINAFDYNCHVDLIKLLQQEGKLHRLRKARQKMSELFPLTEGGTSLFCFCSFWAGRYVRYIDIFYKRYNTNNIEFDMSAYKKKSLGRRTLRL